MTMTELLNSSKTTGQILFDKGDIKIMKKEILNLIESNEGEFVLNNISYLRRWKKSAIGESVDKLVVEFENINNVNFGMASREIVSRDYNGIINEITIATKEYLQEVSNRLCSNLKCGYINSK